MERPWRVLVVSPPTPTGEWVKNWLAQAASIQLGGVIDHGQAALERLARQRFDSALIHCRLTDMTGAELIARARRQKIKTPLIGFGEREAPCIWPMRQAGAQGYVIDSGDGATLLTMIKTAKAQKPRFVLRVGSEPGGPSIVLSDRQIEVVRLVLQGLTTLQIASALGITDHTVDHHIGIIYDQLGVRTRAYIALWGARYGLDRDE